MPSRPVKNDPVDHEIEAAIMIARPIAVEPPPSPGATTSPRPTRPVSVESRVARATSWPAASRMRMIWSGTVPGDHRRDARVDARLRDVDEPDAERQQEQAGGRTPDELACRHAQARAAERQGEGEDRAGDEEAAAAREERRHRVDDDLDPEVRRAPDHPDCEQGDPDVLGGSGHRWDNARGSTGVRTTAKPVALRSAMPSAARVERRG